MIRLRDDQKENELKDVVHNTVGDHRIDVRICNLKSDEICRGEV